MRVLVSTTAGLGHFGPLLPFARACERAGHDVLVAAPESFGGPLQHGGFRHWPFADVPPDEWAAIMARLPRLSFEEAEAVVIGEVFAGIDVRAALPRMMEVMEQWRPDVVLRETCELGAYVAAERFGVPQVRVGVSIGRLEERAVSIFGPALAPARASAGLDEDPGGARIAAAPWCTLLPLAYEDPAAPGPPDARRYCGAEPVEGGPLPAWWPQDMASRPLVYLTFGTVAAGVPQFAGALPAAVGALADLPVRLLVTLGHGGDPGVLGTLPPNVHAEPWVPQAKVLPHAGAVVCHGGFGTVFGALSAGVPLVVSPQFADQPDNAERVAAAGAGVALPRGAPEPEALRQAVDQTLHDPSYRAGAEHIAGEIHRLPPVEDAVTLMEELAGTATT